jgi:hypothetical protein
VLAARLRMGNLGGPPRYVARNAAVQLAALTGLLVLAVGGVTDVLFRVAAADRLPWLRTDPSFPPIPLPTTAARFFWDFSGLLWTVAFLVIACGRWRTGRRLAVVALVVSFAHLLAITVERLEAGALRPALAIWATLLVQALVVAGLSGYQPTARPVRRLSWLHALIAGIDLGVVLLIVGWQFPERLPILDWDGVTCLALVAAVLLPRRANLRAPRWSYALALLAPLVLLQRLASVADIAGAGPLPGETGWLAAAAAEVAAVLGCGLLAAARTRQALRALPAAPDPVTAWSTSDG